MSKPPLVITDSKQSRRRVLKNKPREAGHILQLKAADKRVTTG